MVYLYKITLIVLVYSFLLNNVDERYHLALGAIEKDIETIHMLRHTNSCIQVSKQVVQGEMVNFLDYYDKKENTSLLRNSLLDSLRNVDQSNYFESYINEELNTLSKCEDASGIVFFSNISEDNKLIAELFVGKNLSQSYKQVFPFKTSLAFLISFNEKNEIVNVFTKKIEYN